MQSVSKSSGIESEETLILVTVLYVQYYTNFGHVLRNIPGKPILGGSVASSWQLIKATAKWIIITVAVVKEETCYSPRQTAR